MLTAEMRPSHYDSVLGGVLTAEMRPSHYDSVLGGVLRCDRHIMILC